jgi:hypothetical protein
MLYQAILFVVAKSALAHRSHDNPKIELSGSAPNSNKKQPAFNGAFCEIINGGNSP